MYKVIKTSGPVALALQAMLIPVWVDIFHPSNLEFPQAIPHGMTLIQTTVSLKSIPKVKGTVWANREATIYVYVFADKNGATVQKIYGSNTWNASLLYDIDRDGEDEFLVRQHPAFSGQTGPVISAFKFEDGKYHFSRVFRRDELPMYVDYKFFGMGYWILASFLEAAIVAVLLVWLVSWFIRDGIIRGPRGAYGERQAPLTVRKVIQGIIGLALAYHAIWWGSAFMTAGWVHDPQYWNLGVLVAILSFPLGWAPQSWYPGNLHYVMMLLNSLAWGTCLFAILRKLLGRRRRASA